MAQEVHSGWLTKQGGLHKNWKKRWFSIRGSHMVYFNDQHVRGAHAGQYDQFMAFDHCINLKYLRNKFIFPR